MVRTDCRHCVLSCVTTCVWDFSSGSKKCQMLHPYPINGRTCPPWCIRSCCWSKNLYWQIVTRGLKTSSVKFCSSIISLSQCSTGWQLYASQQLDSVIKPRSHSQQGQCSFSWIHQLRISSGKFRWEWILTFFFHCFGQRKTVLVIVFGGFKLNSWSNKKERETEYSACLEKCSPFFGEHGPRE